MVFDMYRAACFTRWWCHKKEYSIDVSTNPKRDKRHKRRRILERFKNEFTFILVPPKTESRRLLRWEWSLLCCSCFSNPLSIVSGVSRRLSALTLSASYSSNSFQFRYRCLLLHRLLLLSIPSSFFENERKEHQKKHFLFVFFERDERDTRSRSHRMRDMSLAGAFSPNNGANWKSNFSPFCDTQTHT